MVASRVAALASPPETRLPALTRWRPIRPAMRRAHLGELQVQPGPRQRRLELDHLRPGSVERLRALLQFASDAARYCQQVPGAVVLLLRQGELGPGRGQARLGLRRRGREGARVDAEQQVAAAHHLPAQ